MMYNNGTGSSAASTAAEALSVDGRQPVWMILNEARERSFTGEVVFEIDPEVFAYFDNGVVYYAERATDAQLGQRLLHAGVLDDVQLTRGTVRVGDTDHLGRLFDRDESVDRDAVLVMTETSTEELIAELANREIASVRITAYRHHPSGIHRWFVAPRDQAGAPRPVSEIPQLGLSAVDDLPPLTILGDDLLIEWDEPFDEVEIESPFAVDEFELDVDLDVAELMAIETVEQIEADPDAESVGVSADAATDFAVVWPDGTEQPVDTTEPVVEAVADTPVATAVELSAPPAGSPIRMAPSGVLRFEMPALDLRDEPDVEDGEVPDEVAEAVRRAIAAIESATSEVPVVTDATQPDGSTVAPADIVVNQAAPAFAGFAPPTPDMRAEVLYGQLEAEYAATAAAEAEAMAESLADTAATTQPMTHAEAIDPGLPQVGVATMPVDGDEPSGDDDKRTSALRRLIGSLRRKG